jgi:hypothetical protein
MAIDIKCPKCKTGQLILLFTTDKNSIVNMFGITCDCGYVFTKQECFKIELEVNAHKLNHLKNKEI